MSPAHPRLGELTYFSSVLRDAHNCATPGSSMEITFTDTELETREVLDLFLRFATEPDAPNGKSNLPAYINLVSFLRKYDCPRVLGTLSLSLKRELLEGSWPLVDTFVLGSILDCPELCAAAIDRHAELNHLDTSSEFDVSHIPAPVLDHLPREHIVALSEAIPVREYSCPNCTHMDHETLDDAPETFRASLRRLERERNVAEEKKRPNNDEQTDEAPHSKKQKTN